MEDVPFPLVRVQPEGQVQVYDVAPGIDTMEYINPVVSSGTAVLPKMKAGVAGVIITDTEIE